MITPYRVPAWKEIEMTDEGFRMGVFSGKWGICKCKVEITEGPEGFVWQVPPELVAGEKLFDSKEVAKKHAQKLGEGHYAYQLWVKLEP
jgi:hypothetical protein